MAKIVPISARDWEKQYAERCIGWFANHEIRDRSDKSWYIAKPGDSHYAAELIVLRFNCILIHGDIPDVLFSGGPAGPMDKIHWVATSGFDYLASKVRAGDKKEWVVEVAACQLTDHIEQCEGCRPHHLEELQELREELETRELDEHEFRQRLYDYTEDTELTFGQVVSSDVIVAVLAAKTLWRLLQEKM